MSSTWRTPERRAYRRRQPILPDLKSGVKGSKRRFSAFAIFATFAVEAIVALASPPTKIAPAPDHRVPSRTRHSPLRSWNQSDQRRTGRRPHQERRLSRRLELHHCHEPFLLTCSSCFCALPKLPIKFPTKMRCNCVASHDGTIQAKAFYRRGHGGPRRIFVAAAAGRGLTSTLDSLGSTFCRSPHDY